MVRDPDYTVNLQACDNAKVLYYAVSVTDAKDKKVAGFLYKTENYNEALVYAKVFFDEISQSNVVVASYVEQPGILAGQGALYSIGSFAEASPDEGTLYDSLSEEFVERCQREEIPDVNVIFRKVVTRHRLSLYRESKLLQRLQQLGILDKTDGDNEYWIE